MFLKRLGILTKKIHETLNLKTFPLIEFVETSSSMVTIESKFNPFYNYGDWKNVFKKLHIPHNYLFGVFCPAPRRSSLQFWTNCWIYKSDLLGVWELEIVKTISSSNIDNEKSIQSIKIKGKHKKQLQNFWQILFLESLSLFLFSFEKDEMKKGL